jgi:hypothetical protein
MQAARGEGYKRNAFLDGFIRYSVDEREVPFDKYLEHCAGGMEFTPDNLAHHLERVSGVGSVDFRKLTSARADVSTDREQTAEFIRQQTEERLVDKGDSRISAEAEAYAIVANWDAVDDNDRAPTQEDELAQRDVAVLSQGGFLNRIARFGPKPLGRHIVIPPDALYAFLLKSGSIPQHGLSFRDLMVSPFFDASAHFVDKEKYRKFFAHPINDAERIYRENLETFQTQIDVNLKPDFLDDIEPLDRPYFGSSLQSQLSLRTTELEASGQKVASELMEVRQQLKKSEKLRRNVESALARKTRKKAQRQRKPGKNRQ